MYIIIGKEGCKQCEEIKHILSLKHIPYHYTDKNTIDYSTHQYLKSYFPTYPMILKAEWQFINFKDMKEHYSAL